MNIKETALARGAGQAGRFAAVFSLLSNVANPVYEGPRLRPGLRSWITTWITFTPNSLKPTTPAQPVSTAKPSFLLRVALLRRRQGSCRRLPKKPACGCGALEKKPARKTPFKILAGTLLRYGPCTASFCLSDDEYAVRRRKQKTRRPPFGGAVRRGHPKTALPRDQLRTGAGRARGQTLALGGRQQKDRFLADRQKLLMILVESHAGLRRTLGRGAPLAAWDFPPRASVNLWRNRVEAD